MLRSGPLRKALEGVQNPAERLARTAGVVVRFAEAQGIDDLVVTGGAAVAIATCEDFGTRDVDVITARGDELDVALAVLGFEATVPNCHLWVHHELQLVVQSPASNLPPHSSVERVVVSTGDTVSLWSLTDLVIDRLAQVVWHGAYERLVQALALLDAAGERFDAERARQRGLDDMVSHELVALLRLAEDPPETKGASDPLGVLAARFSELLSPPAGTD